MSSIANSIQQRIAASVAKGYTVTGAAALESIQTGCDARLSVINAVGRQLNTQCQFIGFDNKQQLFFTLPNINAIQREHFFLAGIRIAVSLISSRGEGARVRFISRIQHVITSPVPIFIVAMPDQMELCQLRQETRYELKVSGSLFCGNRELTVTIRDLSANGCNFSYDALDPVFKKNTPLNLVISEPGTDNRFFLSGDVRNQRRIRGTQIYGLQFNKEGAAVSKQLLEKLTFDGTRMCFANTAKPSKAKPLGQALAE